MSGHGCELCGCRSVRNHNPPAMVDETAEMLLSEQTSDPGDKPLRFDMHSHILPKQWPSLSEVGGAVLICLRFFPFPFFPFSLSLSHQLQLRRNTATGPGSNCSTRAMATQT